MNMTRNVTAVLIIAILGGCAAPALKNPPMIGAHRSNGCLDITMRENQIAEVLLERTKRMEYILIDEAIKSRNFPLDYPSIQYDALVKVVNDMEVELQMMEEALHRGKLKIHYDGNDLDIF